MGIERAAWFSAGVVLSVALATVSGCGTTLASTTEANVENAARLTAASYRHQDAGTAGAALIREAYCDVAKVLADEKFPPVDAGIPCN